MKVLLDYKVHIALAACAAVVSLACIAWVTPLQVKGIGASYLIVFAHLPSAMSCMLFFILGGGFSVAYLVTEQPKHDIWAASAIAVGVLACTVTLATGSIWARAAWGKWWIWNDPRLLSVAIMWFFFAGYEMLRWAVPEPERRARYSSVFGIIACVNVPIVHFAIKWFGSVSHQPGVEFTTPMRITWLVGLFTHLLVYFLLFRLLVRGGRTGRTLLELKRIAYGS